MSNKGQVRPSGYSSAQNIWTETFRDIPIKEKYNFPYRTVIYLSVWRERERDRECREGRRDGLYTICAWEENAQRQ